MTFTTLLWLALGTFTTVVMAGEVGWSFSDTVPSFLSRTFGRLIPNRLKYTSLKLAFTFHGEVFRHYHLETLEEHFLTLRRVSMAQPPAAHLAIIRIDASFLVGIGAVLFKNLLNLTHEKCNSIISARKSGLDETSARANSLT